MSPPSPSHSTTRSHGPRPSHMMQAAFWMVGAIVSFSGMAVGGRYTSQELNTFELMSYRSLIGLTLVVTICLLTGARNQIGTSSLRVHLLRNICHFAGQNAWFAALAMIPLAQVIALEFTSPLWLALLAPFFLGERLTKLRLMVMVVGFIGAMIVVRPEPATFNIGVVLALCAALGFALSALVTKRLTRSHSTVSILFWLTAMQSGFGLICAGWDGDIAWPSAPVWPWVGLVALCGLSAHFCLTTALSLAPAVTVMPMDFARLPLVAVLGMVLFNEPIDIWVFFGAFVIFAANYVSVIAQTRQSEAVPKT